MSAPFDVPADRTQRLSSVARSWPKLGVLAGVAFVGSAAVVGSVASLTPSSDSIAPPVPLLAVPAVGNPIVPAPAATPAPPPAPVPSPAASSSSAQQAQQAQQAGDAQDSSPGSSSPGSSSGPSPDKRSDDGASSVSQQVDAAQQRAADRRGKAYERMKELRERMEHRNGGGRHRG